jgi:hypothetical protein
LKGARVAERRWGYCTVHCENIDRISFFDLFNNVVSILCCMAPKSKMIVHNELERIQKEVVVV